MSKPYLWKTSKTRKELEEDFNTWKMVGIIFICFFVFMTIWWGFELNRNMNLKQQLSECQEQVLGPVCDFEDRYWGFRVVCSDDFFGWKNRDKVIDQHFHKNLESCEEGLKFYISYKTCEVIE